MAESVQGPLQPPDNIAHQQTLYLGPRSCNILKDEKFWGSSTSASDALLPRVKGHLVMGVRLHHLIGGSWDAAMWGA